MILQGMFHMNRVLCKLLFAPAHPLGGAAEKHACVKQARSMQLFECRGRAK
jgi:hypothetical protein